jgi:hypothetical protein
MSSDEEKIETLQTDGNEKTKIAFESCIMLLEAIEDTIDEIKSSLLTKRNRAVAAYQIGALHASIIQSIKLFKDNLEGRVSINKEIAEWKDGLLK